MIAIDPAKPKGIIWLASFPKSGNTWLRMFLYQLARIQRGRPREEDEINKIGSVTRTEAGFCLVYEKFLGKPLAEASHDETVWERARRRPFDGTRRNHVSEETAAAPAPEEEGAAGG